MIGYINVWVGVTRDREWRPEQSLSVFEQVHIGMRTQSSRVAEGTGIARESLSELTSGSPIVSGEDKFSYRGIRSSKLDCGDEVRHRLRLVPWRGETKTEKFRFSTLNLCEGMDDKIDDVCEQMKDRRPDILCVNKTKEKGSGGAIKRGSFDIYWSGIDQSCRECLGVGSILLEKLSECVNGYECRDTFIYLAERRRQKHDILNNYRRSVEKQSVGHESTMTSTLMSWGILDRHMTGSTLMMERKRMISLHGVSSRFIRALQRLYGAQRRPAPAASARVEAPIKSLARAAALDGTQIRGHPRFAWRRGRSPRHRAACCDPRLLRNAINHGLRRPFGGSNNFQVNINKLTINEILEAESLALYDYLNSGRPQTGNSVIIGPDRGLSRSGHKNPRCPRAAQRGLTALSSTS
ncbi:hypothetical protein EVAR_32197_1 [Eumeta japonica]|uniref:Uncharacterized protein n=1 Tax=Eumeta variegata TaxID=151549 RepID=A0A4C1VXT0_EUMVA|nr:hypothetical protein EVAR_32197_1 [Eumeta japonica]